MDATPPLEPGFALCEREETIERAREEIERLRAEVDDLRTRLEEA